MNKAIISPGRIVVGRKPLWKRILGCWPLYLMLLPAIVYYIVICYVPIFGNVLAFKDYSFKKGIWGSPWVGMKYFRMFFTSYDCRRLILNTLHIGFIKCILEFPFAIILALLLNEMRALRYKKLTQTITYLPHFLSSVIIITMLQRILAPNTGVLNQIIGRFGGDSSTFYLMKAEYFHRTLFLMDIWRNIGWDSIIYLGAIAAVDQELYEAAEVDGAGKLRQFFSVTLPQISSVLFFNLIMQSIQALQNFTSAFVVTNGGPMKTTYIIGMKLYDDAFVNRKIGYASAESWVLFLIILMLTLLVFRSSDAWVYYADGGENT